MKQKTSRQKKPVDDVERLRQVRRQIESEHPTLDALYAWLEELDRGRLASAKRAKKHSARARYLAAGVGAAARRSRT